ncbi:MAG TPA: TolC family protein [Thermoanaerobaculia bacterium]|nr:TolC family protein [Thermoanaerobaculia bacterium]
MSIEVSSGVRRRRLRRSPPSVVLALWGAAAALASGSAVAQSRGELGDGAAPIAGPAQALAATAPAALAATLREVLARNPELARLRAEALAAEAAIDGSASWPDPMASLTAFALTPETRVGAQRWSVSLQQRFPWFGKLAERERQAAARAVAAGLAVEARALELVTEARALLWELAFLDAQEAILGDDRQTLVRYEELARSRYASGVGLQQAVVKLQAEITRLDERLVGLTARRRSLRARLAALRGGGEDERVPLAPLELPAPLPRPSLAELSAAAFAARPEVARARALIDAADATVELAKKEYRPDLSLGLAYTAVSGRDDAAGRLNPPEGDGDDILGVSVSVPLPVWRRRLESGVETAAAHRAATEEGLRVLAVSFERDLGDLLARVEGSARQLELIEGLLLVQAEESLRSAEVAYASGGVGALDLLDAERTLLDARISAARLRADLLVTLSRIEGAVGAPLRTLPESQP